MRSIASRSFAEASRRDTGGERGRAKKVVAALVRLDADARDPPEALVSRPDRVVAGREGDSGDDGVERPDVPSFRAEPRRDLRCAKRAGPFQGEHIQAAQEPLDFVPPVRTHSSLLEPPHEEL